MINKQKSQLLNTKADQNHAESVLFLLHLGVVAQVVDHPERSAITGEWGWATPDQSVLRVIAVDARRQQVVVDVGGHELVLLKPGELIPHLAVALSSVSNNRAHFQPVSSDPKRQRIIESINITISKNGQTTAAVLMTAPTPQVIRGLVFKSYDQ